MLILTRRIGEMLIIGDDICVTVCGIKGNQVRVGIQAPRHVLVDRPEIRKRRIGGEVMVCSESQPEVSSAQK